MACALADHPELFGLVTKKLCSSETNSKSSQPVSQLHRPSSSGSKGCLLEAPPTLCFSALRSTYVSALTYLHTRSHIHTCNVYIYRNTQYMTCAFVRASRYNTQREMRPEHCNADLEAKLLGSELLASKNHLVVFLRLSCIDKFFSFTNINKRLKVIQALQIYQQ